MKILGRDEYIDEVYNSMLEEKEYEGLQEINEGKLKYLFSGDLGLFFNKEWGKIDGDKNIIKAYKEMDSKLTGFTTMKAHKRKICNKIRQELVKFADLWYEHIMNSINDDEDFEIARSMEFEDDSLREGIEGCKKKISEIAKGDNQVLKWAQLLMNDMKIVINRSIKENIKDEKALKEMEEQEKKQLEIQDKIDKKAAEIQKKQLEDIEGERDKLIASFEATPISKDFLGDKAIKELCGEFKKLPNIADEHTIVSTGKVKDKDSVANNLKRSLSDCKLLALNTLMKDITKSIDDKKIDEAIEKYNVIYPLMNMFYENLATNDNMKRFENVPSGSIQAMCIAVNAFVKNLIYEGDNSYTGNDRDEITLMAKCAIVSDGMVSYNLPLNDNGDGNHFTDFLNTFVENESKIESYVKKLFHKKDDDKFKLPDNMKENAQMLVKKIINEAEKLKKASEDDYEKIIKKFNPGVEGSEINLSEK